MTTFGRYQVLGMLGEGGFATVYRALDPALRRVVALKALHLHLAVDSDIHARFVAEARALAALRHPNIVTVFDVGEVEHRPFFTMELIEGDTLAERLAGGPLALPDVIGLLNSLCSTLDYLHGAGLVHRDIKAANIMLDPAGRVMLMDLGIARGIDSALTRTGISLGTPEAMAPEQVRGEPAGPAADIYALGVLAYQLLAGRPPFVGDTAAVLHAHAYEPPLPLQALRPDLPAAMYAAVDAALAKHPTMRPPSAGQFASAFVSVTPLAAPNVPRGHNVPGARAQGAPTTGAKGAIPRPLAIACLMLTALILGGMLLFGPVRVRRGGGVSSTAASIGEVTAAGARNDVPPRQAVVSGLRVCDNVFTCRETEFVVGESVVGCFTVTPGVDDTPLMLLATERKDPPRDVSEPTVIARSEPIPPSASSSCYPMRLVTQSLTPGAYWVWVLAGGDVLARGGFRALAPPTPTPSPTPSLSPARTVTPIVITVTVTIRATPSAAPPAFRRDQLVRINTPGDCLSLRESASSSARLLDCRADASHVSIVAGPETAPDGTTWWKVRPWESTARAEGWALAQYLITSPDCDTHRDPRNCDTTIRAIGTAGTPPASATPSTRTGTSAPTRIPALSTSVTGDWTFTDYIRYGPNAGKSYTFKVRLTQQGMRVRGSGDLDLAGELDGRTLRATYGPGGNSGAFAWAFTADGTRFEGAYTNVSGNGGNSYGRRADGRVTDADQATLFAMGPGVTGDRVRAGSEIYLCFTVPRKSRVTVRGTVSNRVFYDDDDDGTGDCLGPYTATTESAAGDGRVPYVVEMRDGDRVVAQAGVTFTIAR